MSASAAQGGHNYLPRCDNVIYILHNRVFTSYNRMYVSGFCRLLSGWPAGWAVKHAGLRDEWPGFESCVGHFLLRFTFKLITDF